jgi:translocation and assembly module TamA
VFLHGNWFVPTDRQPIDPAEHLPETWALWLEEAIRLDLRDDPRNPREGVYFGVSAQQAVRPLGVWDFVRVVGEVRGYLPLPFGMVLAGRFQLGVMEVFGSDLDPNNVYQYSQLGPPALQLTGGGASSNRGYLPGLLGDAEQIDVVVPRSAEEIANGAPVRSRPVRISAGTRMWEASLELRIPVTASLGFVIFADAGDVDRDRLGVDDGPATFRFDYPQFAFGAGLRYRTIVGPIRFDLAVRPDQLQVLANPNTLPPDCGVALGQGCRPSSYIDLGFFRFPGAFHLTIGEAF